MAASIFDLVSEALETHSDLEKLAVDLTAGVTEPRAKFDKLFHYVAQEIRYQQDYENTIAGVRPHSCPVVLERGYGDCKDKAVVLIALLRTLGIDAWPALVNTDWHDGIGTWLPSPGAFNHVIVVAEPEPGQAVCLRE